MDKKLACHEISMAASKMFVESNKPDYLKQGGFTKLVDDLTNKYIEAYQQVEKSFNKQPPPSKISIEVLK